MDDDNIFFRATVFENRILTRKEAELCIRQTKNETKNWLAKDHGFYALNNTKNKIETFKKWGYDDLIPELNLLLEEINDYIVKNPASGIDPQFRPMRDGAPLPPFEDEGKKLVMRSFRRTNFPEKIFEYPQLEEIAIVGDHMFQRDFPLEIPDKFDKLPNLKRLNLNYMHLAPLPESISGLVKLEFLGIHHGYIREIPSWIGKLTSLKRLDLTSNGFPTLPDSIGNLHLLESLSIPSFENCPKLPKTMANLKNLRIFNANNSFYCFDHSITQLRNIKVLNNIGHPSDIISPQFSEWLKYLSSVGCGLNPKGQFSNPSIGFLIKKEQEAILYNSLQSYLKKTDNIKKKKPKNNFCSQCGAKIATDNQNFCQMCGKALSNI